MDSVLKFILIDCQNISYFEDQKNIIKRKYCLVYHYAYLNNNDNIHKDVADMEKVKSFPPADSYFQISTKVKFRIEANFLEFSASTTRLLDSFSCLILTRNI